MPVSRAHFEGDERWVPIREEQPPERLLLHSRVPPHSRPALGSLYHYLNL